MRGLAAEEIEIRMSCFCSRHWKVVKARTPFSRISLRVIQNFRTMPPRQAVSAVNSKPTYLICHRFKE